VSVRVEQVMGLPVVVDVRDQGIGDEAVEAAFDSLREADAMFSTYRDESEISRINRGELALEDADELVRAVLARCEELCIETDGYFSARAARSDLLDPSGFVKGWAVDRAAEILHDGGARNYAVNAGGDMVLRGGALPDSRWRVGIQHPALRDRVAKVVEASDLAVATSGAYARGEHVFDPHTHRPPQGVLSVTITGPELARVDAYATAAFAMGAAAPRWTARLPRGHEAMTILADGTVLSTPGFPSV
jgi:thiamine biosynthesis lipoprotein